MILVASACGAVGGIASAQDATTSEQPSPKPSADLFYEEIVVTALKRETNLQQTPIAISAITQESFANSGAQNISDLTSSVPSLDIVDNGPSFRRVVIRGIQSAGEATVGTYYDETPVSGSVGARNDAGGTTPELRLFDVERVEVLRGPQGTLYGSGSMGGTLRIIYNKPTFEPEFVTDTSFSSTTDGGFNYDANVLFNTPIVDEKVALRFAGYSRNTEGYIDNVRLGIDDINEERNYGGRTLMRWTPRSNLTVDLAAFLNRTRTDTASWILEAGEYQSNAAARQPLRDDLDLYSVTANWDLQGITATGVVSFLKRDFSNVVDVSGFAPLIRNPTFCAGIINGGAACSPDQLASFFALVDSQANSTVFPQQDMDTTNAELRLSSSGVRKLNWTVGGFFSDRETDVFNPQTLADPVSGQVIQPLQIVTFRLINDELKQTAGFGELSWDVTPRLNLTAGTRYYRYTKDIVGQTPIGNILIGAVVTPPTPASSDESGFVSKLNGSFKINDRVMVYAQAAEGFRPGGVNQVLGLPQALAPYQSDDLMNYELGVKSALFSRRLLLNVAAFDIDWDNIQTTGRSASQAFVFITNAGSASVRGLEAEMTARPFNSLTLAVNATYTDAKLSENQTNSQVVAPGLKDDRIPFIPTFQAGLTAQYERPLRGNLSGFARIDARRVGSSLSDFRPGATFTRRIDSYELVNLRFGVDAQDDRWGAYVYVNNVLDETAILRAFSEALSGGATIVNSALPRTVGITLRTNF
jgi:outer membrane receptor protein involved in Fe transport